MQARRSVDAIESRGQGEPFVARGGELQLSNLGQLALLQAVSGRGAALRTTVRGYSMMPFIRDEDVVTVAPMNGTPPRVGEVVAFTNPDGGRLAIHRVVAQAGTGWVIRGDNCPEPDGVAGSEHILGRVVRVERSGRRVRFGTGFAGTVIAALSRSELLGRANALLRLPRRGAGFALRQAQGLPVYRRLVKSVAPAFQIAVATERDLELVHRQHNPFVPYRRSAPDPQVTNWVATLGTRIVGFVQIASRPEEGSGWGGHWLFSLSVQPRFRGLGIAQALTRQVVERSVADGAPDIRLAVFEDNTRAIALYAKLGFERITVAALEPAFQQEKAQTGRRRIVMRIQLGTNP